MRDWKENLKHVDVMRNILSETGNKIVNNKTEKQKRRMNPRRENSYVAVRCQLPFQPLVDLYRREFN